MQTYVSLIYNFTWQRLPIPPSWAGASELSLTISKSKICKSYCLWHFKK